MRRPRRRVVYVVASAAMLLLSRFLPPSEPEGETEAGSIPFAVQEADPPDIVERPEQFVRRLIEDAPRLARLDDDALAREVEAIATEADSQRLVSEYQQDARAVRAAYGTQTSLWSGVVAVGSRPPTDGRAQVDAWFVVVVAPETGSPYADWRVGRFTLARQGGQWRLAAEEDLTGPTPANRPDVPPSSSADLLAVVNRLGQDRP